MSFLCHMSSVYYDRVVGSVLECLARKPHVLRLRDLITPGGLVTVQALYAVLLAVRHGKHGPDARMQLADVHTLDLAGCIGVNMNDVNELAMGCLSACKVLILDST